MQYDEKSSTKRDTYLYGCEKNPIGMHEQGIYATKIVGLLKAI